MPAIVEVTNNGLASVDSRAIRGTIRAARGPWRSSGQWWDTPRWSREEWDIQADNGRFYRICRQPGGWFVEGIYD